MHLIVIKAAGLGVNPFLFFHFNNHFYSVEPYQLQGDPRDPEEDKFGFGTERTCAHQRN